MTGCRAPYSGVATEALLEDFTHRWGVGVLAGLGFLFFQRTIAVYVD
jgi:hypothetical protein